MPRGLLIAVVVALLAVAGAVEGIRTNRWGDSEDMKAAAKKIEGVPGEFGLWTSTESPIEDKVLRVARCSGHVSRVYTNSKTHDAVSVLMLCGPTGDIAAHTPDVCYAGIGYEMRGGQSRQSVSLPDATSATLWTARFGKPNSGDSPLDVFWGWGATGEWIAPDAPRQEFLGRSYLYKLYVSRTSRPTDPAGKPGGVTVREFLTAFLPEVKKALAPRPE